MAVRLLATCCGSGDELLQATKGLREEVLGPWHQSVWEHGRHLSCCRSTAVYVRYRPIVLKNSPPVPVRNEKSLTRLFRTAAMLQTRAGRCVDASENQPKVLRSPVESTTQSRRRIVKLVPIAQSTASQTRRARLRQPHRSLVDASPFIVRDHYMWINIGLRGGRQNANHRQFSQKRNLLSTDFFVANPKNLR